MTPAPPLFEPRKAPISNANGPPNNAQSISTPAKVNHHTTDTDVSNLPARAVSLQQSGASLSDLPDELLLNIIEHLHDHKDALAKLCRTDKRCRSIAGEVLYRAVDGLISGCAFAVARRPSLAKNIRVFSACITGSIYPSTKGNAFLRVLEKARNVRTIQLVLCHDNPHELPETQRWLELFYKAVHRPLDTPNRFAQLKHLTLRASLSSHRSFPMAMFSSVFSLPALEELYLDSPYQTTPFSHWTTPPSTSSIRDLRITNALMDITAVMQMVTSLKALDHFHYDYSTLAWEPFGKQDDAFSYWPQHSWKRLGDAIKQHSSCLKTFHISETSDKEIVDIVHPNGRNLGLLGSFVDFPRLDSIAVPIEALMDVEAGEKDLPLHLPEQLRTFWAFVSSEDPDFLIRAASAIQFLRRLRARNGLENIRVDLEEVDEAVLIQSPELCELLGELDDFGIQLRFSKPYSGITIEDVRVIGLLSPYREWDESEEDSEEEEDDDN